MNTVYDTIYLSPHLDDAVLSCGGQAAMQNWDGKPVLIVTLMAGDPDQNGVSEFARQLHERWQLELDVVAARRAEDRRACEILGADHIYWSVPDCIYRYDESTGAALYRSNEEIFGEIKGSDFELINKLAERIQQLPAHKRLVVPLGVGNHVDHQITRLAAESARTNGLIYYEEYPYAVIPGAVDHVMNIQPGDWEPETAAITEAALKTKIEAIAAYQSQLSSFFEDRADMEAAVRQYAAAVGGERLWRRASGSEG